MIREISYHDFLLSLLFLTQQAGNTAEVRLRGGRKEQAPDNGAKAKRSFGRPAEGDFVGRNRQAGKDESNHFRRRALPGAEVLRENELFLPSGS